MRVKARCLKLQLFERLGFMEDPSYGIVPRKVPHKKLPKTCSYLCWYIETCFLQCWAVPQSKLQLELLCYELRKTLLFNRE